MLEKLNKIKNEFEHKALKSIYLHSISFEVWKDFIEVIDFNNCSQKTIKKINSIIKNLESLKSQNDKYKKAYDHLISIYLKHNLGGNS